jgi:phosphatidate cytidylyltransferase
MDDDRIDDPTESFEFRSSGAAPRDVDPDLDDDLWSELGARRGPRQAAEGVRIIGADEAAAAIESGQVAPKKPEDELRFGDVPPQPAGPRPALRFPGADPNSVAKPPVAGEPLPPRDERDAAAEAARHWDEVLARAGEGRSRPRPTSALFGDNEEEDDLFGLSPRSSRGRGAPERPAPENPAVSPGPNQSGQSWFEDDGDDAPESPAPRLDTPAGSGVLPQHWTEPPSGEVPRILPEEEGGTSDDDLNAWSALSARPRWRDQPTDWETGDFDEEILADEELRVGALRPKPDDSGPFSFDEPEEDDGLGYGAAVPADGGRAPGRTRISTTPSRSSAPMAPPGGRDQAGGEQGISARVMTGAIAVAILLLASAIGPSALVFLVAVVLTMGSAELYHAFRTRGYQPATLLGLVAAPSLCGAVYWQGLDAYPLVLGVFVAFTLLWYLAGVVRVRPAMNVAVTLMVFLYVAFLGSFAALLLKFPLEHGIGLLLGAILATAAHDIGSFFVGRWAGKTPVAPAVSPGKTVEGLVGGSLATLLMCLIVVRAISPWDGGKAFWLAVLVAVAGPLGDLCESMIKRDLGVKDMGAVLPGHGGVLDRIDGLLFVIPGTFYLVRLLEFA